MIINLNIVGYFIYLVITLFIILKVGNICYKNGNIYLEALIPNQSNISQKINRFLLLGYYLINIGYCAMALISWQKISFSTQLIEAISIKSAKIIFIISILHYLNIIILRKYIYKLIK